MREHSSASAAISLPQRAPEKRPDPLARGRFSPALLPLAARNRPSRFPWVQATGQIGRRSRAPSGGAVQPPGGAGLRLACLEEHH